MIGKYVARFVSGTDRGYSAEPDKKSALDRNLLLKSGFL
jgi:hypothetical protein